MLVLEGGQMSGLDWVDRVTIFGISALFSLFFWAGYVLAMRHAAERFVEYLRAGDKK